MAAIAHLRTSKKSHQKGLYNFQVGGNCIFKAKQLQCQQPKIITPFQAFKHVMIAAPLTMIQSRMNILSWRHYFQIIRLWYIFLTLKVVGVQNQFSLPSMHFFKNSDPCKILIWSLNSL